jgi:flagellar hook-basal body complex protein FliE
MMPDWVKQARAHLGTQNAAGLSGSRLLPDGGAIVSPETSVPSGSPLPSETKTGNRSDPFAKLLFDEVRNVNQMQTTATNNVHSLLTGGDVNEAEVLTSVQKADLAFRMLLQVRNKLMDAYREIQQIQI